MGNEELKYPETGKSIDKKIRESLQSSTKSTTFAISLPNPKLGIPEAFATSSNAKCKVQSLK
jgi:hypothetical protein